jgi:hypothetical protein
VEPVLHLVPEGGLAEGLLDALVHVALEPVDLRAPRHVLEDRLRERVRLLEHHPDPAAHDDGVGVAVDVLAVHGHLPFDPGVRDQLVHPVEAAEQRALPAAGGADERGDLVLRDVERDVLEHLRLAVPEAHALDAHLRIGRGGRLPGARGGVGAVVAEDLVAEAGRLGLVAGLGLGFIADGLGGVRLVFHRGGGVGALSGRGSSRSDCGGGSR